MQRAPPDDSRRLARLPYYERHLDQARALATHKRAPRVRFRTSPACHARAVRSFLDRSEWGDFDARLDARRAKRLAREMLEYDAQGLDVWIGEDFDARVMAVMRAHRILTPAGVSG